MQVAAALLLFCAAAFSGQPERGNLLVDSYGKVLLIAPEGSSRPLADNANQALLSPDGSRLAFTTDLDPKAANSAQKLLVVPIAGGPQTEIVELPPDSHFGHIVWRPDGAALAYDAAVHGKSDDLFIAQVPPAKNGPQNLGHWYQGISFSPDGKEIVHAVNNGPGESGGLEVLDVASGKRTLLYHTKTIVWDARYSPDGKQIAYVMTLREPENTDDEPDCTPPTLGLWIYSVEERSSQPVEIRSAPKGWNDMKNFAWSPDGKNIALTLGTTDCDYPGSAAGVFLTNLSQTQQTRLSTGDMSFEPAFSPDGSAVAFVDFSSSLAKLMRYQVSSGKLSVIREATPQSNYYSLHDWK